MDEIMIQRCWRSRLPHAIRRNGKSTGPTLLRSSVLLRHWSSGQRYPTTGRWKGRREPVSVLIPVAGIWSRLRAAEQNANLSLHLRRKRWPGAGLFNYGDKGSDIYSTSPLARADIDWWNNLDVDALAKEFGAESVYKYGPQRSMDEVGVMASTPVRVGGVDMIFGAHLPPRKLKMAKYTFFNPAKFQYLTWKAGKPVYQLVDPDGQI